MDILIIFLALFLVYLISSAPAIKLAFKASRELSALKKIDVQSVWDNRTDEEILDSFEDAQGWIDISKGCFKSETTEGIADDCRNRLDNYILPQMERRGLSS